MQAKRQIDPLAVFLVIGTVAFIGLQLVASSGNQPTADTAAQVMPAATDYPDSISTGEIHTLPKESEGVREYHASDKDNGCNEMQNRFKKTGRRMKLVKQIQYVGSPNFRWLCAFEGDNAEPGYYQNFNGDKK